MKSENIPMVSILIPTFDQKHEYLRASIQSAIDQTYGNIEIIISNNHSTNGIEKVFNEFNDKRIVYVKPEKHLGLNDHFNFAASMAKGEYICFLSSDDLLYKGCIEKTVAPLIANKELVMVYNENVIIDANGIKQDVIRKLTLPSGTYSKHHIALRMLNNTEYWIIGSVIKREAFLKEQFISRIIAADWVLGFKLLKYGDVAYVNEQLAAIRFHERDGNKQTDYNALKKEHFKQVVDKYAELLNDKDLLNAIGITNEELIKYYEDAIIINVVMLLRSYRAKRIDLQEAKGQIQMYKNYSTSVTLLRLERNFESYLGLLFTYSIGVRRRVKRIFLKMSTKHIY